MRIKSGSCCGTGLRGQKEELQVLIGG